MVIYKKLFTNAHNCFNFVRKQHERGKDKVIKFNLKELVIKQAFYRGEKITLTDVANAVGLSRNTIYSMANSKGNFSTKTEYIERLCRFFRCLPNDLITIHPDPTKEDTQEGEGTAE